MIDAAEWARCRPWLVNALKRGVGTHGIEDVEQALADHDAQFWPGRRCAVITEILRHPKRAVLNFWLVGGDLSELRLMLPSIEGFAAVNGCTMIMGAGRAGWGRALSREGFETVAMVFGKGVKTSCH